MITLRLHTFSATLAALSRESTHTVALTANSRAAVALRAGGHVFTRTLQLSVPLVADSGPRLDFSNPNNSGYVPLI